MENNVQAKKRISTFKRLLGIYWDDVKNSKYLLIFTSALAIFFMPLLHILVYANEERPYETVKYMSGDLIRTSLTIIFLLSLVLSYTVLSNLNYLHNKRKEDLIDSMPIGRRAYLFEKIIFGMTKTMLPLITSSLCGIVFYFDDTKLVFMIARFTGIIIIMLSANLAFGILISICCGRGIEAIVTYITVNAIVGLLLVEFVSLPALFVPGMNSLDSTFIEKIYYITPLALILTGAMSGLGLYYTMAVKTYMIYWVIATIVMYAIGLVIIKFRKSEVAEDKFAFPKLLAVLKYFAAVSIGIMAGLFIVAVFGSKSSSMNAFIFYLSAAIIVFVTYLVLHTIFNRGLSRFKKEFKAMIISFATIIAVIIFVQTGMFGMDKYCPDADEVEYAVINVQRVTSYDGYYSDDYIVLEDVAFKSEDIKNVINLHKEALESLDEYKSFGLYKFPSETGVRYVTEAVSDGEESSEKNSDKNSDKNSNRYSVFIKYTLKDGTEIERDYDNIRLNAETVDKVDNLPEYGKLAICSLDDVYHVSIIPDFEYDYLAYIDNHSAKDKLKNKEWFNEFKECYVKEYDELTKKGVDVSEGILVEFWVSGPIDDFEVVVSPDMHRTYEIAMELYNKYTD